MIASLVSLLGLLGDVMGQVDGIKVLRAMLRHRENMLNGRWPSNLPNRTDGQTTLFILASSLHCTRNWVNIPGRPMSLHMPFERLLNIRNSYNLPLRSYCIFDTASIWLLWARRLLRESLLGVLEIMLIPQSESVRFGTRALPYLVGT